MSGLHNEQKRHKNIHALDKVHIDAANKKASTLAKRKAARNRRLVAFFIFATVVIGFLGKMIVDQNDRLDAKQQVLNQHQADLEEILEVQEQLKLQIAKLDDDEYIAKLARKELFLSEEGEMIFTIPEKTKGKKSDEHEEENDE